MSLYDQRRPECLHVPDVTLNDPRNRKIKVIIVGAGIGGILNSYNIENQCQNVEYVVYEKNEDIGGTWFENRYPGCACDVPSHAYAFHFAPNPDWPRFLSSREDIWNYLDRVCKTFDLRKHMRFNTQVTGASWNEDLGQWKISSRRAAPDGNIEDLEETADVFWYATGLLNNWKWPDIHGLDTFEGRLLHTANWPDNYTKKDWEGQKVAVIGSGASSIQTVQSMQPDVAHMDIFVRTGVWFAPIADHYPADYEYSVKEIEQFRANPEELVKHHKIFDAHLNIAYPTLLRQSKEQELFRANLEKTMSEQFGDEHLLKGFLPKFAVGCRRITPGYGYIKAIQEPNVDVHFTNVTKIIPSGIITGDGILIEVDTVIAATGFDTSHRPRFPISGRNGARLQEMWKTEAFAYFGTTIQDMPNFVMNGGPPTPLQNGTPMGVFHAISQYGIELIKKLQFENIKSLAPRVDAVQQFRDYIDAVVPRTVFSDSCRSWYRNNETGKVTNIYPGSALHFIEMLSRPRWEDYDIRYRDSKSIFAFMGWGSVKQLRDPQADMAWYLRVDNIDPLWLKEIQSSPVHGGRSLVSET